MSAKTIEQMFSETKELMASVKADPDRYELYLSRTGKDFDRMLALLKKIQNKQDEQVQTEALFARIGADLAAEDRDRDSLRDVMNS